MNKTITLFRGNTFLGNSLLISVLSPLWKVAAELGIDIRVGMSYDAFLAEVRKALVLTIVSS